MWYPVECQETGSNYSRQGQFKGNRGRRGNSTEFLPLNRQCFCANFFAQDEPFIMTHAAKNSERSYSDVKYW